MKKHYAIFVPGLGDEINKVGLVTKHWNKYEIEPVVYLWGWLKNDTPYEKKLESLINKIDYYSYIGGSISLIGLSAGGSAVLNAFAKRKKTINKVVSICARLRRGEIKGLRSFKNLVNHAPQYAESIKIFSKNEPLLTLEDRRKIMTIRAKYGDEFVPDKTATIDGALNFAVPTIEHVLSIAVTLTIFSSSIISFLKKSSTKKKFTQPDYKSPDKTYSLKIY